MKFLTWFWLATVVLWNTKAENPSEDTEFMLNFILRLMRDVHADAPHGENVVFTPLSIAVALATAFDASTGKTREELTKFLGLPTQEKELEITMSSRLEPYRKIMDKSSLPHSELSLAAGLFVNKDVSVSEGFVNQVRSKYLSEVANVDFGANGKEAAAFVNKYISDSTKGRISSIISSDSNFKYQAVIVSALYFYGVWKDTFIRSQTKPGKFRNGPEEFEVQMMKDLKLVSYCDDPSLQFQSIQIPFKRNSENVLTIILPYESQSLTNLTNYMKAADLGKVLNNGTRTPVEYQVPRMKFSSVVSLKKVLIKEGLTSLFQEKNPFGKITKSDGLIVDDFLHAAEIEVDELGMKAGAGTTVPFPTFAIDFIFNQKQFVVNRPYILILYNRPSGFVLSAAFVHKPNADAA